jgi:RNA polymerase sigma-70 factor (ECF subfamily)
MEIVDDPDAWIRVFRSTLPELYAFVARRVGDERTLAEDVTQETWLRAVQAWRKKGLPSEPIAWLKTTARNLVLNHFRDASRRPLARVEIDLEQLDLARHAAPQDGAAGLLQHGLSRLRADDAELIEAFHLDGRSTRELAQERGVSERAIEGRLHRARAKLRDVLEKLG